MLRYNPWRGHASGVVGNLQRALGQYRREWKYYKVGLTMDPEERWRSHNKDGWEEMIVVYETSSAKYAGQIEDLLISWGWEREYGNCNVNERRGRGGLQKTSDYYCVYVILSQK